MNINLLLSHRVKCLFFVVPMLLSIGVFGVFSRRSGGLTLKQPQTLEFQPIAFAFM